MRNRKQIGLYFPTVFCRHLLVVAIALALSISAFPMQAGIASPTKDQDNEKRSQSNLRTEIRQGAAMSLRARQLISKNKAFARAYADMIKRGLRPVFEEHGVTILAVDLTKLISYRRTSTAGLQDITDGSHEMSFFPFDNGNAATWEGIVYVRGPNDEATYQVMLDTTHEDLSQTEVYYEIYYPPDGGPGECTDGPCPILASLSDSNYAVRQVSYSARHSAITLEPQSRSRFRMWLGCSAAGCTTGAIRCAFSGPGYLKCLGIYCGSSLIGCAVGVLIAG